MIPHIFHYYRADGRLSTVDTRLMDRLQRVHPNWKVMMWDDSSAPQMTHQARFDNPTGLVAPGWETKFKSNLIRAELIYQFGGVWTDTDMLWVKPIDELLEGVFAFGAATHEGHINQAVVGAEQGHPFFKSVIDAMAAFRASIKTTATGAYFWTSGLSGYDGPAVSMLDWRAFYSLNQEGRCLLDPLNPLVYGVHLWNSQSLTLPVQLTGNAAFQDVFGQC